MARITFSDATGDAELHNQKSAPGDRFGGWTPDTMPFQSTEENLATGLREAFVFRTDYLASFDVRAIPASQQPIMLRLQAWLRSGGTVTVATEDLDSRSYLCGLAKDGDCTIELSDVEGTIEYTMHFTRMLNSESADLLCIYQ